LPTYLPGLLETTCEGRTKRSLSERSLRKGRRCERMHLPELTELTDPRAADQTLGRERITKCCLRLRRAVIRGNRAGLKIMQGGVLQNPRRQLLLQEWVLQAYRQQRVLLPCGEERILALRQMKRERSLEASLVRADAGA